MTYRLDDTPAIVLRKILFAQCQQNCTKHTQYMRNSLHKTRLCATNLAQHIAGVSYEPMRQQSYRAATLSRKPINEEMGRRRVQAANNVRDHSSMPKKYAIRQHQLSSGSN
jgi:hypothetical protein